MGWGGLASEWPRLLKLSSAELGWTRLGWPLIVNALEAMVLCVGVTERFQIGRGGKGTSSHYIIALVVNGQWSMVRGGPISGGEGVTPTPEQQCLTTLSWAARESPLSLYGLGWSGLWAELVWVELG